jgi:ankyrin repeat protein
MDGAARNGHLEIVRLLRDHRSEGCTAKASDEAANNGHLEIVHYLVENQLGEQSTQVIDGATANGHLDVVRWLMEHNSGDGMSSAQGVVMPAETAMDRAAADGHLVVLDFLYATSSIGCSAAAIIETAAGGHASQGS